MDLNDFCALNSGDPMRYDFTGRGTAPDITMVHASLAADFDWRVGQDVSSDHRPIVITTQVGSPLSQKAKSKPRPCLKKTDWDKFREVSENTFAKSKFNRAATLNTMVKRFTSAVKEASVGVPGRAAEGSGRARGRSRPAAWRCAERWARPGRAVTFAADGQWTGTRTVLVET